MSRRHSKPRDKARMTRDYQRSSLRRLLKSKRRSNIPEKLPCICGQPCLTQLLIRDR